MQPIPPKTPRGNPSLRRLHVPPPPSGAFHRQLMPQRCGSRTCSHAPPPLTNDTTCGPEDHIEFAETHLDILLNEKLWFSKNLVSIKVPSSGHFPFPLFLFPMYCFEIIAS